MTIRTKDILSRTLEIIEEPDNWLQGTYARNEYHEEVSIENPTAIKCCLLGALWKASYELYPKETVEEAVLITSRRIQSILKGMPQEYKQLNLEYFNDHQETSHEDVLDVLKQAIAKL